MHDKDCPQPHHEPYFHEWNIRGFNVVDKYIPERFQEFDPLWNNWHKKLTKEEFERMPLLHEYKTEFTNTPKDPPAMSPKKVILH